jgi:enamine deaminase RidA (YjgF/YER057c/UK114 family)
MITRLAGAHASRSRAVVYNGIVHAVATSPDKMPSVYQQTRLALADIDRSLAEAGTTKARILTAIVYLADMAQKPLMNQAWDEWAALDNPPMRACIGATLEGDSLIEIVVTAALPESA